MVKKAPTQMSEPSAKNSLIDVIVDETLFVYATRGDHELHSQIGLFLSKSDKSKADGREFSLHLTNISAQRLGMYSFYDLWKYWVTKNERKKLHFEKRRVRKNLASEAICRCRTEWRMFLRVKVRFFKRWKIMDLFVYANEAKRNQLSRQLEPSEVIPLEMCQIAYIAHQYKMPIFSFNKDFEYFLMLSGGKKPYIDYWNPDHFLRNLRH